MKLHYVLVTAMTAVLSCMSAALAETATAHAAIDITAADKDKTLRTATTNYDDDDDNAGVNDIESEDFEEREILDELKVAASNLKRQRAAKAEMKTYESLMNMGPHQQTKKMEML